MPAPVALAIRISADLSAFRASMGDLEGQLATTKSSMQRMTSAFDGAKLIADANAATAAINGMGGASTLTATEQGKANAMLTQAIDKYKLLGQQAPSDMVALANATKQAEQNTTDWSGVLGKASGLLATFGIGLSVGALVGFGKELFSAADGLTKMSDQTGIGIQGLQKLQVVGDAAGNSIEDITGAVNKMQKRIAGDDSSAAAALAQLGLHFSDLKGLAPDLQFMKIGDAIKGVEDPAERTRLAMELFGKSGATVLPTLVANFDEVRDHAVGMSDETAKNLDKLGDKVGALWRQFKGFSADVLVGAFSSTSAELAARAEATALISGQVSPSLLAGTKGPALNVADSGLPTISLDDKSYTEGLKAQSAAVALAVEAEKQHQAALKASADAFENIRLMQAGYAGAIATLDGGLVEAMSWELKHGASVSEVSKAYMVASPQVQALADHLKLEGDTLAATNRVFKDHLAVIPQVVDGSQRITNELDGLTAEGLLPADSTVVQFNRHLLDLKEIGPKSASITAEEFDKLRPILADVSGAFEALPNTLIKAFTGGGGLDGAIKAFGVQVGQGIFGKDGALTTIGLAAKKDLTSMFGDVIGGALSSAIPVIGSLIGPGLEALWSGIKKLFGGPSKEELQGRDLESAFQDQMLSIESSQAKAITGADTLAGALAGLSEKYQSMGANAEGAAMQAQADFKAMFDAEKEGGGAVQAVIDGINSRLAGIKDKTITIDVKGNIDPNLAAYQATAADPVAFAAGLQARADHTAWVMAGHNEGDPGEPTVPWGFSMGTLGATGSYFKDFGSGTPATLHGNEAVVRSDQASDFAAKYSGGGSGAGGNMTVQWVTMDGRTIAEAVVPWIPNTLRRFGLTA